MGTGPKFDHRWLRFVDAEAEKGFLASRHTELANKFCLACGLGVLYVAIGIAVVALSGWQNGGSIFTTTTESYQLGELRNLIIIAMGGLGGFGMLVARLSLTRRGLSPRGLEIAISCIGCLGTLMMPLKHPWYLAKVYGIADPWPHIQNSMVCSDDKLLLYLDILLTGLHLMLPLRWVALLPVELAVVFCYVGPAVGLGSYVSLPEVLLNTLMLILLVFAAAWGKRALERHERIAFAKVAAERTLRVEAEHKLWRAQESQITDSPVEADASSLPTTTFTGEVFAVGNGDGTTESQLAKIMELGLQEHWLVKPEALQPLNDRILGAGGFGIAMVARYHGAEVVLKAARSRQDRTQPKVLLAASEELRIFRRLHHPNIVGFFGACVEPANSEIVLVLEYIKGRELQAAIDGIPSTPEAVVDRCVLADNVCSALKYLHAQRPIIIHGDIKGSNVLVEQLRRRRNAKLVDFGLSRLLTRKTQGLGGTLSWMAPEVLRKDTGAVQPSADAFSFGRLAYLIMTGRSPLHGVGREAIIEAARNRTDLDLDWPEEMPLLEEAKALCSACQNADPKSRPSMAAVQASLHQWSSSPGLPIDIADAISEQFPQQIGSGGGDLHQALERARNMRPAGSNAVAGHAAAAGHAPQEEAQPASTTRLLVPEWEETPERSRMLSLARALMSWNVPVPETGCCSRHALIRDLRRLTQIMVAYPCMEVPALKSWQCPHCKTLSLPGNESGHGTCELCPWLRGSDVATGSGRRREALESLSKAPEEETPDSAASQTRNVASL